MEALRVFGLTTAGGDDLSAIQKCIGDGYRLVQQPTGVVPQVEHEPLISSPISSRSLAIDLVTPFLVCSLKLVIRR